MVTESPLLLGDAYSPGFHKSLSEGEVERVKEAIEIHGKDERIALKMKKDTSFEGYVYLEDGREPNVVSGVPPRWFEVGPLKVVTDEEVASLIASVPTCY